MFQSTFYLTFTIKRLNQTLLVSVGVNPPQKVSDIEHNSELILSRNNSPLDCLHLALVYRYYFVWRRHENMSPCTGSRVISNYERIASRVESQFQVSFRKPLLCPVS